MKISWKAVAAGFATDIAATIALQTILLVVLVAIESTATKAPFDIASFTARAARIWLPLLLIGVATTGFGGYVAGRMAPVHKPVHGLLVGAVGLSLAALTPATVPTWRFVMTAVAAIFAGWLGGCLAARVISRQQSAEGGAASTKQVTGFEQPAARDTGSLPDSPEALMAPRVALPRAVLALFGQALGASVLRRIDWARVQGTPALLAALVLIDTALSIGLQRMFISGPANFDWKVIFGGWLGALLLTWCCYLLASGRRSRDPAEPSGAQRFAAAYTVAMLVSVLCALALVPLTRSGYYTAHVLGPVGVWIVWLTPLVWSSVTSLRVLVQNCQRRLTVRLLCVLLLAIVWGAAFYYAPTDYWLAAESENSEPRARLDLTQETFEAQQQLFASQLAALKPQRAGVIDLYAITFAPYAEESVFKKESAVVADVMQRRFDAAGRTLQLLNHNQTTREFAWATPLNLQRAISAIAAKMDRDEDILFLHLTSHGARNGELAASFWPLDVDPVTPVTLKQWLDDAGVRNRVISISACYSGSWADTLANDNTLVMTAADATHTSYGCGHRSALTYFGRAMYDEQLRTQTLSFEQAHQTARIVIKKREEEAGKDDGYSNPQIKVGASIRARLALLEARLRSQQKQQ